MAYIINTVVEAEPESCRDTAKQLRDVRRSADEVDTGAAGIGKQFSGSTASGQTATALAGACTVLTNGGHFLSADLDAADMALVKFANGIEDVKAKMEAAIGTASSGGLQFTLERNIVLPAEPTPAMIETYNQCVGMVGKARESEYDASKTLAQAMNALADQDMPGLPMPQLVPLAPAPAQDGDTGSGDSSGGSSGGGSTGGGSTGGGSTGGSSGGGDGQVQAVLTTAGGNGGGDGGGDGQQSAILQEMPDWQQQHDLADQVQASRLEIANMQLRLAETTDPLAHEQLTQDIAQAQMRCDQLEVRLDEVRVDNQELQAANQEARADGGRVSYEPHLQAEQLGATVSADLRDRYDGTEPFDGAVNGPRPEVEGWDGVAPDSVSGDDRQDDRSETQRSEARQSMASRLGRA